jgi:hypothetical protein
MSLIVAIANSATAAAHDHRIPTATIHGNSDFRRGRLFQWEWIYPADRGRCVTSAADGPLRFRGSPLAVGVGARRVNVKFHKRQRPKGNVDIASWSTVDPDGFPVGDPTYLPSKIFSRGAGAQRRWLARFTVRAPKDAYLAVTARWRDRDGCGGTQSASWRFLIGA